MDCTTEKPRRPGRKPMTVILTVAELAAILDVTPSAVSKRIERGQELTAPKRYGLVKDVTNEARRKHEDVTDPVKSRNDDVAGIASRSTEPGNILTLQAMLLAAWDAGYNRGSRR